MSDDRFKNFVTLVKHMVISKLEVNKDLLLFYDNRVFELFPFSPMLYDAIFLITIG